MPYADKRKSFTTQLVPDHNFIIQSWLNLLSGHKCVEDAQVLGSYYQHPPTPKSQVLRNLHTFAASVQPIA